MIAPRLGNASISFASMGARPASTIALTEAPCSARKSSRPASIGSTRASYFAVSASASGGGTSPTCRTVAAITPTTTTSVRRGHRQQPSQLSHVLRRELLEPADAEQFHGAGQLAGQDFDGPADAGFATGHQPG